MCALAALEKENKALKKALAARDRRSDARDMLLAGWFDEYHSARRRLAVSPEPGAIGYNYLEVMKMKCTVIALSVSFLLSPALATAQVADSPVSLSDAQSFEAPLLSDVSHAEITDARRAMASAVSAEKFIDGVKTVFFVALAAYGAYQAWWADGSSSTVFVPQQTMTPAAGGA